MSSEQVPLIPNTNLPDTIYCAEQIKIPAQLPEILKNYTKHIIKTQPTDLVAASAEYFGKLAKQRIKALHGSTLQTPQQIEAIYKKLATQENGNHSKDGIFSREDFSVLCVDITNDQVTEIFKLGGWGSDAPWIKFWALLVASNAGVSFINYRASILVLI